MTTKDNASIATALAHLKTAQAALKVTQSAGSAGSNLHRNVRASLRIVAAELAQLQGRESKRQRRRAERRLRLEMQTEEAP